MGNHEPRPGSESPDEVRARIEAQNRDAELEYRFEQLQRALGGQAISGAE